MENNRDYDVLVVGSGPGGKHAAIAAAHLGKKVCIIERKPRLGGVSLQSGTIPSKALREAAYLHSRFASKGMRQALSGSLKQTDNQRFLQEAVRFKNTLVEKQESILLHQLMRNGVSVIPGEAKFTDPHTLEIHKKNNQTEKLTADFIVLAAGSRPRRPTDIPFDKELVLDSTSALNLERVPDSMIIVGGGVIACELATLFAPLGAQVTIIDSHPYLLDYLDRDITTNLGEHMQDMKINLHMLTKVKSISRNDQHVTVITDSESHGEQTFVSSHLIYAMGREPNAATLCRKMLILKLKTTPAPG